MAKNKILIVGANSKTAIALISLFLSETSFELVLFSRSEIDIPLEKNVRAYAFDPLNLKKLKSICYSEKPNVIINTHSYNDVSNKELNRKKVWDANVIVTENLVSVSRVLDCTLIQLSCEQIFNGKERLYTEQSIPDPLNYYGKAKLAAENACLSRHHKSVIVRCCPLYGFNLRDDFYFNIPSFDDFSSKMPINAYNKLYTTPTFVEDLAVLILKIIDKKRFGVYNCGGPTMYSQVEIFLKISEVFNFYDYLMDYHLLNEVSLYPLKMHSSGLINLKAETDLGVKFTSLENGLLLIKYNMRNNKKRIFSKFSYLI